MTRARILRSLAALWIGLALLAVQGLALAAPLPVASPESVGLSAERLAKLGPAFQQAIDEGQFPGAVVMVARRGKLVYAQALGKRTPDGAPMPEDAIFRIYSMTKPLVSVAAMLLVEDGKIELTDPVGKFLPGFDKMTVSEETTDAAGNTTYQLVPATRAMTVQDLLRHSSGLAYGEITKNPLVKEGLKQAGVYRTDIPFDARGPTPAEEIEAMARAPLAYQPGTVWYYSLATDVLGRVVEAASGRRLADFMRERLFVPLKMDDSGFWVAQNRLGRVAEPFARDTTSGQAIVLLDVSQVPNNDSGGAGGVSTAGDYLRFCQMLLNGGTLDGARVMSRTTIRWMASDHLGDFIAQPLQPSELLLGTKGYTFGLGFAVRRENGIAGVAGSAGDYTWGGYAGTYFWVDPTEQLTAVLMTQSPGPQRAYYRKLLRQLVYQAVVD